MSRDHVGSGRNGPCRAIETLACHRGILHRRPGRSGFIGSAGAVSEAVARAMAEGALARSKADIAVSVTGVAGPTPDEDGTPVGIVHFVAARRDGETLHVRRDYGDTGRGRCRHEALKEAMNLFQRALNDGS